MDSFFAELVLLFVGAIAIVGSLILLAELI